MLYNQSQSRPMIESSILASMVLIFSLVSAYMPIVGIIASFIWPIPIVILGVRHGHKWSIMATVIASILTAILVPSISAARLIIGNALFGIVLGYAVRAEFRPVKTLLWGSTALFISNVALFFMSIFLFSINDFTIYTDTFNKMAGQVIEVQRARGLNEETIATMTLVIQSMIPFLKLTFIMGTVFGSIAEAYLKIAISQVTIKKLGFQVKLLPKIPKLKDLVLPEFIVYIFLFAIVGRYWGETRNIAELYNVSVTFLAASVFLLFVQGLAFFYYLADKYNLSRLARGIILILIFTNFSLMSIMITASIIAGAFDMLLDYRQLRGPR